MLSRLKLQKTDLALVMNAGSMMGTSLVTSGLGFVYWWLAARLFSPESIGFGSAFISAMMLMGNIGLLGLGTLLIGELPRRPSEAGRLITTSLIVTGTAAGLLGILGAFAMPYLSSDFSALNRNLSSVLIFAAGVALTTLCFIIDQALIGLLRGDLQFLRNTIFSVVKMIAILLVGLWVSNGTGLSIYITWTIGNLVSLILLLILQFVRRKPLLFRPQWELIGRLRESALRHYALNLSLQAPTLLLPVIVTVVLSASMNAAFYVAWMIAGFIFFVPTALSTVLFAVSAANISLLAEKLRFTLRLSAAVAVGASLFLFFAAPLILKFFGSQYVEYSMWTLRILAFGTFPLIIKVHYTAICRINNKPGYAAKRVLAGGAFELAGAWIGAELGGLVGFACGWLIASVIEGLFLLPLVYQTASYVLPPINKITDDLPPEITIYSDNPVD